TAATTVLLAAVWFVSGGWIVVWEWDSTRSDAKIGVWAGAFQIVMFQTGPQEADPPWPGRVHPLRFSEIRHAAAPVTRPRWRFAFVWWRSKHVASLDVEVPLWIPASASLLAALILSYLDRRGLPSSCPHCRYDLSATPPSAPCPECGEGGRAQQRPNAQAA